FQLEVDLIVLAGFLKKIPNEFVSVFVNKIINIHPALLPKYGGKGMYGANVHKAVFEAQEKISGATVHFVNKIYDDGKIIEQRSVDITDVKSPTEIAERVLKIEHELLPDVIKKIAKGTL
ncbi:MAG: formyltransferase family protein, partial [Melioribacteraceae bacterium]